MVTLHIYRNGKWDEMTNEPAIAIERMLNIHGSDYGPALKGILMEAERTEKIFISGFSYDNSTFKSRKSVLKFFDIICPSVLRSHLPTKRDMEGMHSVGDAFVLRDLTLHNLKSLSVMRITDGWETCVIDCDYHIRI